MSLNWSIEKVKDWRKKNRSKRNREILNALIWSGLIVGISSITEKNYAKYYARLTAYEHLHGTYLYKGNKPYYITIEDVMNWIGLSTNVAPLTAAQFEKVLLRK